MTLVRKIVNRIGFYTFGFRPLQLKTEYVYTMGAVEALAKLAPELNIEDADKIFPVTEMSKALGECFHRNGSDKAESYNEFQVIYAELLKEKKDTPLTILEIGLGTHNTNFPSNMRGNQWKPGGSLRAWRDFFTNATVYGADIDKEILFEEERIRTFFVDQLSPKTFAELTNALSAPLDLIVDDGLHMPIANFNTLNFALPLLKSGGYFVVEDIFAKDLTYWRIALSLVPEGFETKMVRTGKEKATHFCIIKKYDTPS